MKKIMRCDNHEGSHSEAGVIKENITELISQTISLYDSVPVAKKFFLASRQRLENLLARIGSSQTRIAVIGITSSGKSTLLNAILGQNLLPTAVAPSSGRQVLCGYDTTLHADIIFSPESGKQRLVVTENIKEALKQYGDENSNKGNFQQVDEIHVYSPSFKFDHSLIFVDTPGLDAYNLGVHEEITLKLVLPTVDMILFLTNVKCDSDGQNLEFIDRSTSEVKPLIVVQNKINSISAKMSKRGIEKTVADIKQEHLNRLQRLLAKAQKESVRKAPIVQVSANAPTWELSNLEMLKQVLAEQIKVNSAFRENLFLRQFIREVDEMQGTLSSALAESKSKAVQLAERKTSMVLCEQHIKTVKNSYLSLEAQIQRQCESAESAATQLLTAIDNKYGKNTHSDTKKYRNPEFLDSGISMAKENLSTQINTILKNFSDSISRIQAAIKAACADLNLQESQVVRTEIFGTAPVLISECQKVIPGKKRTRTEKVKKEGLLGGVARLFGGLFGKDDWGYIDKTTIWYEPDTTVCDISSLIQEIKKALAHLQKFLSEKIPVFQRNTEYSISCLQTEYERKMQEIQTQFQVDIPLEQGNKLLMALQKMVGCTADNISKTVPQNPAPKQNRKEERLQETSVPAVVFDAVKAAENMALECHWSLMQGIIKKSGMTEKYICGWDINCMENFRDIFFRNPEEIKIIDFSDSSSELPKDKSLLFLLVNAEQPGSSAKKICQPGKISDFILSTAENGMIVWVMDSVDGFISVSDLRNDTLIEAYAEMLKIAQRVQKKQELFEVMACSRELYYTVLFHELYFNLAHSPSEKRRQQLVEEMAKVFHLNNERKHATGQYINHFINYMKG